MDAGDHRHAQPDDALHQGGALGEQRRSPVPVQPAQFSKVVPGAEGRAGAGDHRDAYGGIGLDLIQCAVQCSHQRCGQGVARRGTVQRQPGHAVPVIAKQQGFVGWISGHVGLLPDSIGEAMRPVSLWPGKPDRNQAIGHCEPRRQRGDRCTTSRLFTTSVCLRGWGA